MILVGSKRGGGADLAVHLMKAENDHVEIHELRGFISDDLRGAFKEIHAVSKGTRARQYLYSLSLNPPKGENVPTSAFEDAIERAEKQLGLEDQPRAVVFHVKDGRRHAHVAWSRINSLGMKAIPMPHFKRKLNALAKELFLEHGWQLPAGFRSAGKALSTNFTLAEWQQAKRAKNDPRAIKAVLREAWNISKTQNDFAAALRESGYVLARGDRRGFVGVDYRGEIYAIPKWTNLKAKDVRGKLTAPETLPSVDEAKGSQAKALVARLQDIRSEHSAIIEAREQMLATKHKALRGSHEKARVELKAYQKVREIEETKSRQEKFNKGIRGFVDRVTGRRRRIAAENEAEALQATTRDREQRDALIFTQVDELCRLQTRVDRLKGFSEKRVRILDREIKHLYSGHLPAALKGSPVEAPNKELLQQGRARIL